MTNTISLSDFPKNEELVLVSYGINWNWYCHVVIGNDLCAKVIKEYRLHKYDESQGARTHPAEIYAEYSICEPKASDETMFVVRRATGIIIHGNNLPKDGVYIPFRNVVSRFSLELTN